MLQFITDVLPGEPDILDDVRHKELRILNIDGSPIKTVPAPADGWTHDATTGSGRTVLRRDRGWS